MEKIMNEQARKRYFGDFGGRFIPEVLVPAFEELEEAWASVKHDRKFFDELERAQRDFVGRPTPLLLAENLTTSCGGGRIWLKMEALAHTGAHKINNALGQGLLAKKMGKKRLIAETGAGQHGLATAAVAARLGLECEIFMGEVDMARQHPNVYGMRLFGARVTAVTEGSRTLTDAVNAAMKSWTERVSDTHYLIGSALGPYPFPEIVRTFQSVIGKELRSQFRERYAELAGRASRDPSIEMEQGASSGSCILAGVSDAQKSLPDVMVACVGGGSNSIGLFHDFLDDESVRLVGVEAGGHGTAPGEHAVRMTSGQGRPGVVQAYRSIFLQDDNGSLLPTSSVSAGLDYAGIGPELAYYGKNGRIEFTSASDEEVLDAVQVLARTEGILPALESAHALAAAVRLARTLPVGTDIVVNISGRGDKDLFITAPRLDGEDWLDFLKAEVARLEGLL